MMLGVYFNCLIIKLFDRQVLFVQYLQLPRKVKNNDTADGGNDMKNLKKDYAYNEVHFVKDFRDLIRRRCELYPDTPVFELKNGKTNQKPADKKNIEWTKVYPKEYENDVKRLGSGLLNVWRNSTEYNPDKKPRVAILSETRYEWYVSYMAVTNGLGIVIPLTECFTWKNL